MGNTVRSTAPLQYRAFRASMLHYSYDGVACGCLDALWRTLISLCQLRNMHCSNRGHRGKQSYRLGPTNDSACELLSSCLVGMLGGGRCCLVHAHHLGRPGEFVDRLLLTCTSTPAVPCTCIFSQRNDKPKPPPGSKNCTQVVVYAVQTAPFLDHIRSLTLATRLSCLLTRKACGS